MQDRVKGPAIGLMVAGGLGILLSILVLTMSLVSGAMQEQEFAEGTSSWVKMMSNPAVGIGFHLLALILSSYFIFAGLKMKRLESWNLSMLACVLALLPCTCSCFLGLPFGIWGLITLMNEEVKQAFRS